jgi:two-component system chemotaxis sensor kinase CheA
MDEELYQAFVTESEESITKLNNSLLTLESNPDDREAMDEIFRRAHTLKGNFGAMGFDNAATLAHAIEDLLDEVRQGQLEVTPERMDRVFDGVDRILDILHEIEERGESDIDPAETVAAIRSASAPESGDRAAEAAGSDGDEPGHDDVAADAGADGPDDPDAGAGPTGEDDAEADGPDDPDAEADGTSEGDAEADGTSENDAEASPEAIHDTVDRILAAESGDGTDDGAGTAGDAETAGDPANGESTDESAEASDERSPADLAAAVDPDALADVEELYHVAVSLGGGEMKSVDGNLFVDGIPDAVSVLASDPSLDAITEGEFDDGFELVVAGLGAEETAETFADLWAVEEATVTDVSTAASAGAAGDESANDGASAEFGDGNGFEQARPADEDGSAEAKSADEAADATAGDGTGSRSDDDSDGGGDDSDGGGDDARSISAVKSVRVDVEQLDELHELVEQLVTSRIKLRQAVSSTEQTGSMDALDELDKISSSLQGTVMDMRLIPLRKVFDKFPRLVRDLARAEDKRVNFEVTGEDIELDRTILDEISDPLMHVLRNAVDHGIEPPEERAAAGKPETGTVELRAEREHDTVVITVEDDGQGLATADIEEKAVEQGLATPEQLATLSDEEVYDYIFHPGFSTNDEITDVSGRGVGMDVVKTTVESLDGSVSVSSTPGSGTTFRIRLPVSVAIIKVLFVRVGERQFGVPIKYIDEIARFGGVERINGAEVVVHEEDIYPLIRLRDALGVSAPPAADPMVVRIRPADRQVALRCDGVTRQEEVVVTPLQGPLSGSEGLSGTAVIGDGNVIPILDIASLSLPDGASNAMQATPAAIDDSGVAD